MVLGFNDFNISFVYNAYNIMHCKMNCIIDITILKRSRVQSVTQKVTNKTWDRQKQYVKRNMKEIDAENVFVGSGNITI